ncbi:MAG: 50S ribosomal protein L25/general stress protein Ctc [Pseudomonadota bacterium]
MSNDHKLEAQLRERSGKGAARELRRNNMVPAVIYGDKKPPVSIALPIKELTMMIHGGGFMTNILTVTANGETHKVLPKDYQQHPVKDTITHVDLLRVSNRTIVTVEIPVQFENEDNCAGLKEGGVLNVVRYAVEVNCPANSIPDAFTVDLAAFGMGDSINISSVAMPDGVEPTITDRDFTLATIAAPAGLASQDDEEGAPEAPETEVINQSAEDDDSADA